jgi:hypothetical protein
MSGDLAIIEKLEKKLGRKFEAQFSKKIDWFESYAQYELNDAEQVIKLRLHGLELLEAPLEIVQLENLQLLYLTENQLRAWPVEMAQLVNLQLLYLGGNQLRAWPVEMAQLVNLQLLYLSRNQLNAWPVEMAQLENLQQLYLDSNQLSVWPVEMAQLQNLQKLYLRRNQLSAWPVEMAQLVNLQWLDLSENQLSAWPVEMAQLVNLQQLNLSKNRLKAWPVEMAQLGIETYWEWSYGDKDGIFLEDNPLKNPPPEIIKQGNAAIIEYFKAGQQQRLNEVKILLIGDGGAGKTSLVKRLLNQDFDPTESQTKGININEWEVVNIIDYDFEPTDEKINDEKIKIKTHLWDFGGQEVMHATHQFFLSKRSLYILVLDNRKDEKTEYWLKYIESFGGNSPILIILNKIDQNPGFELDRKSLQKKYPGIQGFHRLSCKTNEGMDDFRHAFQCALSKVEIRHADWPQTWFQVKTKLAQLTKPYIDYERYTKICNTANVNGKEAQQTLLQYLCDLGITLYFQEHILEDTHVLEPKWVTKAVYKIINARQVADTQGILYLNELEAILEPTDAEDYHYPRNQHPYIIGLMKRFELCYELVPNRSILIPDLLPVQKPDFTFATSKAIQFRIDYRFLPRSVMPRFIVNRHQDIQDELRWRKGVILKDDSLNASALIIADDEERQIFITVNGDQRRDYFATILKTLRTIHNSFEVEKLGIDERVCLRDNPKLTIGLKHLYNLDNRGIRKCSPEGAEKDYLVRELLGTVESENFEEETHQRVKEIHAKIQETKLEKATESFLLQPNFFGIGINLNKLFKWLLGWDKKK